MHVHLESGQYPIILSVPHDGGIRIVGAATRIETQRRAERGLGTRDLGTLALARACRRQLSERGVNPSLLWFDLHRSHVDVNRSPDNEPFAEGFQGEYEEFHRALAREIERNLAHASRCLLVDFHGYVRSPGPEQYDIVVGSNCGTTSPRAFDRKIVDDLGTHYRTVFSPDATQNVSAIYRGGWIVRSAADQWSSKGLDAVQLEFNHHMRQSAITESLALRLAEAVAAFMG